jgi:hypothetical protein
MSTFEDRWFEVWFSPGEDLRPTWLLILTPDQAIPGHFLVYDPQENFRIVHSGDYEDVLQWLAEDEFSLVEGRMFPDDGLPLDFGTSR